MNANKAPGIRWARLAPMLSGLIALATARPAFAHGEPALQLPQAASAGAHGQSYYSGVFNPVS
jgi:hypothetical protein